MILKNKNCNRTKKIKILNGMIGKTRSINKCFMWKEIVNTDYRIKTREAKEDVE